MSEKIPGDASEDGYNTVPSYAEAVAVGGTSTNLSVLAYPVEKPPSTLSQSIARAREQRITKILAEICPLLQEQAKDGQSRRLFILVPSDWEDIHPDAISTSDFPEKLSYRFVILKGQDYRAEFWQQPSVIRELEVALRSWLTQVDNVMVDNEDSRTKPTSSVTPTEVDRRQRSRFAKFLGRGEQPQSPPPQPMKLGWRSDREDYVPLGPGKARIGVGLRGIRAHKESATGLLEFERIDAIAVNFEVGT